MFSRSPVQVAAITLALAAVTSLTASGATPPSVPTDLEDRTVWLAGKSIGVEPRSVEDLEPTDALRLGWAGFGERHPGRWKVLIDERSAMPTLVTGRGIEWFPEEAAGMAGLAALESAARDFLAGERRLLGSWESVLRLDAAASAMVRPGHWQLVFRQVVDGIPVENARLDLHVIHGRLVMFGATHWSAPEIGGLPTIDAAEALRNLREHLDTKGARLLPLAEPELTILAIDADRAIDGPRAWKGARGQGLDHVLLWRFRLRDGASRTEWVGEVDAHDGAVREFRDDTDYAAVRGGVFPTANDGDCATGGCEAGRFPMPFTDYDEQGQVSTITDGFGNLQCVDDQATFAAALSGPYVHIEDHCGAFSESGTCGGGVDLGMKGGENCAGEPGISAGNTAAARTAFYHVNRIAEVARSYDPGNTWLESPLTVNVNVPSTCNAFWSGGELVMHGEGLGCGNMGELRGILAHEWGHGYDHNDGGSSSDSPAEGYSDIMAMFATRSSCVARGWYNDGRVCDGWGNTCLTCNGIRDIDWAAHEDNAPANPTNHLAALCPSSPGSAPCGRQVHCEGVLVGETLFDLATRDLPAMGIDADTAWQVAERLWFVSRIGSGGGMYFCILPNIYSCGATSLHNRLLAADDDDGDLSNGTPHAGAIYAAFDRHEMACGSASDPENQNHSSCPVLATPALSVAEMPAGSELSWTAVPGAAEYRVYRGELGCDRQQVRTASLSGGTTGWTDAEADQDLPRFYRIEAVGTNDACTSAVSSCASTPAGARLQMTDYRFLGAGQQTIGFPNPGETVDIATTLFNNGLDAALATQGVLSLADPSQGQVLEPSVSWGTLPASTQAESAAPHFEIEVADTVPCGSIVAFDVEMSAANASTEQRRFSVRLGEENRDLTNDTEVEIPPETVTPVTSTIEVDQDLTIAELDVSLRISHGKEEELIVELTSPGNTTVRLHDQTTAGFGINTRYDLDTQPAGPGTMADFLGESAMGTWTLSVQDVGSAPEGVGHIDYWTMHTTVVEGWDCVPGSCSAPVPDEAPDLRVARTSDGGSPRLEFTWTSVPLAAGYNVTQSPVAPFDQDVELVGQTDDSTTMLTVDDTAGPALTFYQTRGVNACGDEGP